MTDSSRGGQDEAFNREIAEILHSLNEEGELTEYGAKAINSVAGKALLASNRIRTLEGTYQSEYRIQAEAKLKELRSLTSESRSEASGLLNDIKFIVQNCAEMLDPGHTIRLKRLQGELETTIKNHDDVQIEFLVSEANQEMRLLPDEVNLLLAYREAVARANRVNPTHGRVMISKFGQMLLALKEGHNSTANMLMIELKDDVQYYLDQQLPTSIIATRLTQ